MGRGCPTEGTPREAGYLAGDTGSSSAPGRCSPSRHAGIPATHSRTPRSPRAVPSPPPAKTLGERDTEPGGGHPISGMEGAPGHSQPPSKKPLGANSPHSMRDSTRAATRAPRRQRGWRGAPARTLAHRGAKPPWGSYSPDPAVRGRSRKKVGGLESICHPPAPREPKAGCPGAKHPGETPKPLQTPPHKGATPERDQQQERGVPQIPLLPLLGSQLRGPKSGVEAGRHQSGVSDELQPPEKPPRPSSLNPCLSFPA